MAAKIFLDAVLRLGCAITLKDPFKNSNMTIYWINVINFFVMFCASIAEAFYFRTSNEEAGNLLEFFTIFTSIEWIVMASYGVSLVLLTAGRSWHLYGRRMRTNATIVKPDGERENVKLVSQKDSTTNDDTIVLETHTKGE